MCDAIEMSNLWEERRPEFLGPSNTRVLREIWGGEGCYLDVLVGKKAIPR